MAKPRFAGEEINLGGTVYTVPPLAMHSVRTLLPKINRIEMDENDMPTEESMDDVFEILHAAFERNYPDVELKPFVEMIDIHTFLPLIKAVFGGSGFKRGPEGNALAAANPSTGTPSTPSSAPSSAGAGSTSTST
jgi:hypothetical protein